MILKILLIFILSTFINFRTWEDVYCHQSALSAFTIQVSTYVKQAPPTFVTWLPVQNQTPGMKTLSLLKELHAFSEVYFFRKCHTAYTFSPAKQDQFSVNHVWSKINVFVCNPRP